VSVAPADPHISHTSAEERISVDEGQLRKLDCQGYLVSLFSVHPTIEEVPQTSYQRPSRTRGRAEQWQGLDSVVKKRDFSRSSPVHGAVDRSCRGVVLTRRVSRGGNDQRADPEKKGCDVVKVARGGGFYKVVPPGVNGDGATLETAVHRFHLALPPTMPLTIARGHIRRMPAPTYYHSFVPNRFPRLSLS
jgi:hypothetical protein